LSNISAVNGKKIRLSKVAVDKWGLVTIENEKVTKGKKQDKNLEMNNLAWFKVFI
jgi:hypothetical protein